MKYQCIYCESRKAFNYSGMFICNSCLAGWQSVGYMPGIKIVKNPSKINWILGVMRLGCVLSILGSGFVFGWISRGGL